MNMEPLGWVRNGVLHLLPGVSLEQVEGINFEFMGRVVDSEGVVLKEAQEVPDCEAESDWTNYAVCWCGAPAGTPCLDLRMHMGSPLFWDASVLRRSNRRPHKERKQVSSNDGTEAP